MVRKKAKTEEKVKVRVKEFVARIGITQVELAEKIGVKKETVYKWADGTNSPTLETARDLKRLGITDYELYGEEFQDSTNRVSEMDILVAESLKRVVSKIGKI